ncbi:MAG: fibronectin type III domain-containing protein [Clostridia bacterium]|nr:fibronectin type III domain-containing protein [Clostridia bacterium]
MKLTKKVLSIILAVMMLGSCLTAFSASAASSMYPDLVSEEYDDNILISYDQFIRDYSYGTVLTSPAVRRLTFNKYGWMRAQSQTDAEYQAYMAAKAVGDTATMAANEGLTEHQWQLRFIPTEEYNIQFKNAVANSLENKSGVASFYCYVNSATRVSNDEKTFQENCEVDFSVNFLVEVDTDFDGVYDDTLNIGQDVAKAQLNNAHTKTFRYINAGVSVDSLWDYVDMGLDFRLKDIGIQPRNYDSGYKGIKMLDVFISPVYVDHIPGFEDYNFDNSMMFDAPNMINPEEFTFNALGPAMDPDNWQWKAYEAKEDDYYPPIYAHLGYGDILRDADKYPIKKDGTKYIPEPVGKVVASEKVVITEFKATKVDATSVTLSWTSTGGAATQYFINEVSGKFNKTLSGNVNSCTITGLTPGTTYQFRIKGNNNQQGAYFPAGGYITVKTTSAAPAKPAIKSAVVSDKNQVKVTWGKAANAAKYLVERKIGSGKWTSVGTVAATSIVDKKATAGGTYSYRVTAISSTGAKSAASTAKTVKVMSFSAKAKISTAVGKKQVTITVKTKVTNATGYEYVVGTNKAITKGKKSVKTTKTKTTIKSLKAKTVYYAKVRAYKTINGKKVYGAWSAVVKTAKTK